MKSKRQTPEERNKRKEIEGMSLEQSPPHSRFPHLR